MVPANLRQQKRALRSRRLSVGVLKIFHITICLRFLGRGVGEPSPKKVSPFIHHYTIPRAFVKKLMEHLNNKVSISYALEKLTEKTTKRGQNEKKAENTDLR